MWKKTIVLSALAVGAIFVCSGSRNSIRYSFQQLSNWKSSPWEPLGASTAGAARLFGSDAGLGEQESDAATRKKLAAENTWGEKGGGKEVGAGWHVDQVASKSFRSHLGIGPDNALAGAANLLSKGFGTGGEELFATAAPVRTYSLHAKKATLAPIFRQGIQHTFDRSTSHVNHWSHSDYELGSPKQHWTVHSADSLTTRGFGQESIFKNKKPHLLVAYATNSLDGSVSRDRKPFKMNGGLKTTSDTQKLLMK